MVAYNGKKTVVTTISITIIPTDGKSPAGWNFRPEVLNNHPCDFPNPNCIQVTKVILVILEKRIA